MNGTLIAFAVGVLVAWFPAETHTFTPVIVSVGILIATAWAWQRTPADSIHRFFCPAAFLGVFLIASAWSGADKENGLVSLSLAFAVAVVAWVASRSRPSDRMLRLFGLSLAALALLGVWQWAFGFERALEQVHTLPLETQTKARELLLYGRVFGSQLFPGHLSVLLVVALALLIQKPKEQIDRVITWVGISLVIVGLVLARSPLGAGLAVVVSGALMARERKAIAWVVPVSALGTLALVVLLRPDLAYFEPLVQRIANWKTAIWVWTTSPLSGVGWGGFGQASLAVPFSAANRPTHAHSLPLEWMADLGIAGVMLSIVFMFGIARLVLGLWPRHPHLAAATAVLPAHNLIDFSLFYSGPALPWAVLLGWAIAARRDNDPEVHDGGGGRLVAVAFAAGVVGLSLLHVASRAVEDSLSGTAEAAERCRLAQTAAGLAPWRAGPKLELASASLESSGVEDLERGAAAVSQAQLLRPRSATVASLRSAVAVANRALGEAAASAWWAHRAQPDAPDYKADFDSLVAALQTRSGPDDS